MTQRPLEFHTRKNRTPRPRTKGIKQPKCSCFHCKFWGDQHTDDRLQTGETAMCYWAVKNLPPVEVTDENVMTDWNDGCDNGEEWEKGLMREMPKYQKRMKKR